MRMYASSFIRMYITAAVLGAAALGIPASAFCGTAPRGAVAINFDDTFESPYPAAVAYMEEAGFRGTFYIVTERIRWGTGFLGEFNLRELAIKGHEIGAHTRTHRDLTTLTQTEKQNEIIGSRSDLRSVLGSSYPPTFAYPFGSYDASVKSIAQGAYRAARTIGPGLNFPNTDRYALEAQSIRSFMTFDDIRARIDNAVAQDGLYIMVVHHMDEPGQDYNMSLALFKQVVDYLKNNSVRVVTNTEAACILFKTGCRWLIDR